MTKFLKFLRSFRHHLEKLENLRNMDFLVVAITDHPLSLQCKKRFLEKSMDIFIKYKIIFIFKRILIEN